MIDKFLSGKVFLIITIVVVLMFILLQKCLDRKNMYSNQNDCHVEFNKKINGVVAKAFFDENPNHKGFVIEFTNGYKYRPPFFLKKLESAYLSEGDSIYKKAGTFKFIILKKGYESPVIVEDTVNCDELK